MRPRGAQEGSVAVLRAPAADIPDPPLCAAEDAAAGLDVRPSAGPRECRKAAAAQHAVRSLPESRRLPRGRDVTASVLPRPAVRKKLTFARARIEGAAMLRLWLACGSATLAVSVATADPASDCSQHQDADRRIRGCGEFIRQNPRHPDLFKVHHNRAMAYWKKGQHDAAIRDYDKAIELKSGVTTLYYDRGTLLLMKKQHDRAIADFDKALALNPRDDNSLFQRGSAFFAMGQYVRAIQDFDKAIEINPRSARTFFQRGNALLMSKQAGKAVDDYSKTIALNPKLASAYLSRGLGYEVLGRTQEAIADLKTSLALDPRLKASQDALKRLEAAAVPRGPPAAEGCDTAKEPKKCQATRALLQQLKTDPKAARWNNDVDFEYAKGDDEQSMLFKFMLESIPARAPRPKG
jgi:tetratricopeptide (TPR) repeat protein